MIITVVDTTDSVGTTTWWIRLGTATSIVSTADMVSKVLAYAGGKKIDRLQIFDHGNTQGMQIGTDWISLNTLGNFSGVLGQLKGHFAVNGAVPFFNCRCGQNTALLIQLAQIFGVPVSAGIGDTNSYGVNTGTYNVCEPNGVCRSSYWWPYGQVIPSTPSQRYPPYRK